MFMHISIMKLAMLHCIKQAEKLVHNSGAGSAQF
jgi:hypothetical protein